MSIKMHRKKVLYLKKIYFQINVNFSPLNEAPAGLMPMAPICLNPALNNTITFLRYGDRQVYLHWTFMFEYLFEPLYGVLHDFQTTSAKKSRKNETFKN